MGSHTNISWFTVQQLLSERFPESENRKRYNQVAGVLLLMLLLMLVFTLLIRTTRTTLANQTLNWTFMPIALHNHRKNLICLDWVRPPAPLLTKKITILLTRERERARDIITHHNTAQHNTLQHMSWVIALAILGIGQETMKNTK